MAERVHWSEILTAAARGNLYRFKLRQQWDATIAMCPVAVEDGEEPS